MPKPMAEVGEGGLEGGSGKYGVYSFIRDLIVDGNGARFVNKEGRFVVNWPIALECYAEFKSKKNSKSKKIDKRKASNGLRAALLNFYKKEGAQEFKESKKVNEKDEVVERQFQMPPRIFKTLFADLPQTDDSEPDSISVVSEDEDGTPEAILETLEIHSHGSPHSSDTGFDEAMDISDGSPIMNTDETLCFGFAVDDFPSEEQSKQEDAVSLQDIPTPSQMFHLSEEEFDSAFKDILSDGISENDLDLSGVVQDISPSSGSVKGGQRFHILLSEQLPDDIISGVACFEGCGTVFLEKLNCSTLRGFLPAAQQAGPVPVIIHTQAGQYLGKTWFLYVDEVQEMLRQLVKDPAMQSMFFNLWAQEHGNVGSDGDLSQTLYPFIMQSQGSSYQTKSVQSLEVLQLLVYTAAQTDAQQFIHMIFDTSAGRTIFDAYKSRTPLPEDVARANGHQELAQFLQEITRRYSEESSSCGVQSRVIDWQELVQAVEQTQKQPPGTVESTQENDDNLSEYFADAETSSCGSFELDVHWSDSEDSGPSVIDNDSSSCMMPKSITNKESTITSDFKPDFANGDIGSQTACLDNKVSPSGERLISNYVHTDCGEPPDRGSTKERKKSQTTEVQSETSQDSANDQWKPSDTKIKKDALRKANPSGQETPNGWFGWQIFSRMFGWEKDSDDCTPGQQETTFVKEERKDRSYKPRVPPEPKSRRTSPRSSRRKSHLNSRIQKGGVLCAIIMLLLLAGFKLNDDWLLRWAVENGQTQIAKILVQCGCDVNAQNAQMRLPLHLAAQKGHRQIAELLLHHGSHVDVRDFLQQTPLHLAAQYGHQPIAEVLLQRGIDASAQDNMGRSPLQLAALYGHEQITEVLLQHGVNASTQDNMGLTPLHLAALNGHKQITEVLLQRGIDASAQDFMGQTPLHLAALYGHKQITEVLLQHGVNASTQDNVGLTPLHLAAQCGHKQITEVLFQRGIDASTQDFMGRSSFHLAAVNGYNQITEVLLPHGIDVSTQDYRGPILIPFHFAAQNGHKQVTEALLHDIDAFTYQGGGEAYYALGSCPPGTSVSLTGGCETYANGTYSKQENSPQCTRCDTCRGRRSYEIKPCNATSNTQCGCQPGSYYGGYLICLKCSLCKRGQGVSQNCSATRDTVCTTCEKGKTFSSFKDLKACTPSSHCPEGHIVKSECTRRADTVCKREKYINNSKWTGRQSTVKPVASKASTTRVSAPSTSRPTLACRNKSISLTKQRRVIATTDITTIIIKDSTSTNNTYFYELFALGSLLNVFFLVVVLGICLHRRRKQCRLPVSKGNLRADAASETSISTNDGITITDNRGSLVPLMVELKDKLLRNASCSLIQELSQHLNPNGRWKDLAGQLQFNVTQISNFGIDQNVATEKMLTEWGHRDGSTVVALYNTFINLKWKNEARIVKQYM